MLANPRFAGSNLDEDDGVLRGIKIRNTSFGWEAKPSVPSREILRHVKEPYNTRELLVAKIHRHFLPSFFGTNEMQHYEWAKSNLTGA
jgi:hypothetical protein